MVLATMGFGDYRWKINPVKLEIIHSAGKKQYIVPEQKVCVEGLQRKPVVYRGTGEFFGEDCLLRYRELRELFLSGRKRLLSVPEMPSVYAWFTELKLLSDTSENLIIYSFEFVEADTSEGTASDKIHICTEGETLYDIAFDYGVSLERLVALNPNIRRPDLLNTGKQVRLC